jgi:hypothetical protein
MNISSCFVRYGHNSTNNSKTAKNPNLEHMGPFTHHDVTTEKQGSQAKKDMKQVVAAAHEALRKLENDKPGDDLAGIFLNRLM